MESGVLAPGHLSLSRCRDRAASGCWQSHIAWARQLATDTVRVQFDRLKRAEINQGNLLVRTVTAAPVGACRAQCTVEEELRAECCCRNLQPIHADEMPESLSASDQLVTPAVVSWGFAQLIDLSDDGIHTPVIRRRSLCQVSSVLVQAEALRMGRIPSTGHAYGRDMTLLSLFRQATGEK